MVKNLKSFTLIELLVVIFIIGILATLITINASNSRNEARYSKALADMKTIATAAELYNNKYGAYPKDMTRNEAVSGTLNNFGNYEFLTSWPKAPCKDWFYDWENWSNDNGILRVTLREWANNGSSIPAKFFYCLSPGSSSNCDCPGPDYCGGSNILTIDPQVIKCNE